MSRRLTGSALRALSLLISFVLAIGVFTVVKDLGWRKMSSSLRHV